MSRFMKRVQARWAVHTNRRPLGAVDGAGLEIALVEFGLLKRIERGELKCKYCESPVERSRIYALFRESGAIKVVCARPECIEGVLERWSR